MMSRSFVFVFFSLEEESVGCIVAILKLVLLINIKLFILTCFCKPVRD